MSTDRRGGIGGPAVGLDGHRIAVVKMDRFGEPLIEDIIVVGRGGRAGGGGIGLLVLE